MKKCARPGCVAPRGSSAYCLEHDAERKRAAHARWKGWDVPPARKRLPAGHCWGGVNSAEDTPIAHVYDWRGAKLSSLCGKSQPIRWTELPESHEWPKCLHCGHALKRKVDEPRRGGSQWKP